MQTWTFLSPRNLVELMAARFFLPKVSTTQVHKTGASPTFRRKIEEVKVDKGEKIVKVGKVIEVRLLCIPIRFYLCPTLADKDSIF